MASGSRRRRGNDEYVFIDGKAMRSDEAVRIDIGDAASVPGQEEAASVPGADERDAKTAPGEGAMRRGFRRLNDSDAFELTEDAQNGTAPIGRATLLMQEDRQRMRVKYLAFGVALLVIAVLSLCISSSQSGTFHSPADVFSSIGAWFKLTYAQLFHNAQYVGMRRDVIAAMPYYTDCILQVRIVIKYIVCGGLLAISGMLFQNTFRNPIAAPSMLGISNGMNFALLILVLQYGYAASQHTNLYYIYSAIGGLAVLALVMLGGKWISGKGRFNVVNMILMGTIISQLLGVVMTYAEAFLMDEVMWEGYYNLQNAAGVETAFTYIVLFAGTLIAFIPIYLFRFRLNTVSFTDQESKLLGVNPDRLRVLSLGCGSLMILIAQLTVGQVSMVSLIVPFVVRAVFGSEMRKQIGGNLLVGALVLLVCGDLGTLIVFDGSAVGVSMVVSVVAIPLFVWMLAIRQRSWE